ncbi:uncharacterized protein LOC108602350 [Drosophila busckii]|uniref:uncharacterized protein LOC108602350 n=1 Tax=Drosophila busckii TaxID=30019 RepID=UPI00083F400A|nr:uncharacterized protein LOC108602350 [Drosophila busckii]
MATESPSLTRSQRLAAVDVKDLLPKCIAKRTVTQVDYVNHMAGGKKIRAEKKIKYQTDPALISGHYANNLKVNDLQQRTRTWPYAMHCREEYRQFLRRTKWCNEEIYKLFFECPPVRYDQIEDFLRDMQRTIYGSDYSPNDYESLLSQKRADVNKRSTASQPNDYLTTYQNSYNIVQEVERFREAIYKKRLPKDMTIEEFEKNMRKLFRKYGLTTYYEEVCLPALLTAKDGIMPAGPIDRYTLRRI